MLEREDDAIAAAAAFCFERDGSEFITTSCYPHRSSTTFQDTTLHTRGDFEDPEIGTVHYLPMPQRRDRQCLVKHRGSSGLQPLDRHGYKHPVLTLGPKESDPSVMICALVGPWFIGSSDLLR